MNTLTITLTSPRLIDGYIKAANGAKVSPAALALEFAEAQGRRYADGFAIGLITSAAFIARFTPPEYGAILAAAETNPQIAGLIAQLTAAPNVALDDPRLAPGLALLVTEGLLAPERVAEVLAWVRPTPEVMG